MSTNSEYKAQFWFFTFGSAHRHPNGYVKIFGPYSGSRDEMVSRYGDKWAFQYGSAEEAGVQKYNLYEVLYDDMKDDVITDKDII